MKETERLEADFVAFLQAHGCVIRGFVHCAGVYPIAPLRMMSDEAAHDVFDVNLFSAMALLRVLTKKRVNHGALQSVVMVSSINSYRGASGFTAYCASKGAVDAFVRAAAVELAPHIRVNAVRPGIIQTHEDSACTDEARAIFQQPEAHGYLLGNGREEDIVSMIRYLLSERARWITGQCFTVDGGLTAH